MNKTLESNSMPNLCSACELGKSHRLPMSHVHISSTNSFDIIHVELWGLFPVIFVNNMR